MDYLWEGRGWWGPFPGFTTYRLSADRIFEEYRLLTVRIEEVELYRVTDLLVEMTLVQRIFGLGTITVISSDPTRPRLLLKDIRDPLEVKERIYQAWKAARMESGVRSMEMLGGPGG